MKSTVQKTTHLSEVVHPTAWKWQNSQKPNQKQGITIDTKTISPIIKLVYGSRRARPEIKAFSGGCTLGGDRLTSHHWWVRRPKHRVACHWQAPLRRTSWDLTTNSAKWTNSTKYLKNRIRWRMGEWVSKTTTRKKLKQLAGIVKTLPVDESMHLTRPSFQEKFTCLRSMSCLSFKSPICRAAITMQYTVFTPGLQRIQNSSVVNIHLSFYLCKCNILWRI